MLTKAIFSNKKQVSGTESEQPAMTIETNYFGITYNDAVEEAIFFSSLLKTALHIFPYKIGINYKYPNHFSAKYTFIRTTFANARYNDEKKEVYC